jgi:predicted PurR-regulated permease PerM
MIRPCFHFQKLLISGDSRDRHYNDAGGYMTTVSRISYGVLALALVLAGLLHLGVPLLAILFSYFALSKLLALTRRRWISLILFVLIAAGIAYAAGHFTRIALKTLPEMAEHSIPSASAWAEARQIELPFTDLESLKGVLIDSLKEEAHYLQDVAKFAGSTTTTLLFVLIGIVVAASLFLSSSQLNLDRGTIKAGGNNLYSALSDEIAARFRAFYRSFDTVMGAQITISLINTLLTAIFVLIVRLPNAALVIPITFVCGLLPIVGNLVSNAIIVFLAFTVSLKLAMVALIFLIAIHKLEYFLNSKIIGVRIRNPVWLTLLALIIGERLMGVPGMVLAPVVLDYLRLELSNIDMAPNTEKL